MKFSITTLKANDKFDTLRSDALVIGLPEGGPATLKTLNVDEDALATLTPLLKDGSISGKSGTARLLLSPTGFSAKRVVMVGLGKCGKSGPDRKAIGKATTAGLAALNDLGCKKVTLGITTGGSAADDAVLVNAAVLAASIGDYVFDQCKSKPSDAKSAASELKILVSSDQKDALKRAVATSEGMKFTKDLGNLPGNICTPTYLGEQAKALGKEHKKLKVTVLGEAEMKKLGMGSLLSVSRGSVQEAKLIVMEYNGGKKGDKPKVVVGKGLTFDAGGISIKPGPGMDEMKYDMCGGATVFGLIKTVAEMGLEQNIIGIVPSSENLPDGDANKPGDIVTSMAGKTIEILNTDAEGRLILCDALTYAERFDPEWVIDLATLTGAVIIALGREASGLFTDDSKLRDELIAAGESANDRVWQLPLWDEYQELLSSNFADIANIGGRDGGSITAACFLKRFTEKYRWAHIDIAGTSWVSGKAKGASGRPLPLLVEFLTKQS